MKKIGVSENGGFSPKSSQCHRVFHYKPSILGENPPIFGSTPKYTLPNQVAQFNPIISNGSSLACCAATWRRWNPKEGKEGEIRRKI